MDEIAEILQLKAEYYKALAESYLTAIRRFQHLSNVNVADDEERSYTDSTTDSKFDRVFDGEGGVSNINGYAWCKNKGLCEYLAYSLEVRVEIYKDATEKSLALAQKYLDSSGSKKQDFAEEEAKKLDSESKDKSESNTRDGHDTNYAGFNTSYHFANEATKYLKQAQASANQTKHWRKKLDNKNHHQKRHW